MADDRARLHAPNAVPERRDEPRFPPERTPADDLIDQLEDQLHALDREIDELRRRLWMVRHEMIEVDDKEVELDRLEKEFRAAGDRFVETYNAWSRQHEA